MKIAVTGSTGFIGSALIDHLLKHTDWEVVALTRSEGRSEHPRLHIHSCDLYSLSETEEALKECDAGIYLVHSMGTLKSRLAQGEFADFDVILADNFARAAEHHGLKQIIYVSGLLPGGNPNALSKHLKSRGEVEAVLKHWKTPVTTLRCGIVIGAHGSSFQILERLVDRLPVMLLPRWMRNRTQAVALNDLIVTLRKMAADAPQHSRRFDLASPEVTTYRDLLIATMKARGKSNWIIDLPAIPLFLSKYWVYFITRVPQGLVYPLIDSLNHEMLGDENRYPPPALSGVTTSLKNAIEETVRAGRVRLPVKWKEKSKRPPNEVQSVQRLPMPGQWNSKRLAESYQRWLPKLFRSVIRAEVKDQTVAFNFLGIPLLVLKLTTPRDFEQRRQFLILHGALVKKNGRGTLEFRDGFDQSYAIAAIHRFEPRLPWPIYRCTQAVAHEWVMGRFARHLRNHSQV